MAYVVDTSTGEIHEAPDEQLDAVQADGRYRVANDDDLVRHNEQIEYSQPGQLAQATGEAAVRGLTAIPGMAAGAVGLQDDYDPLVPGFGEDEEIRARQRVLESELPGLATAAGVVPDIALGAASGGLAFAGSAGRAALKAGGKAATKRFAAAGAAESLAAGVSAEGAASYVEDREFAATNAAANIAADILFVGALGGGAVAARALGAGVDRAADAASRGADSIRRNWLAEAVGPQKTGQKMPGDPGRAKSAGAAAADDFDSGVALDAVEAVNDPAHREAVLEVAEEADGIHRRNAVAAADRLDNLQTAGKAAGYESKVEDFRQYESSWDESKIQAQMKASDEAAQEGLDLVEKLRKLKEGGKGDFGTKATIIPERIEDLANRVRKAPAGAERLVALDRYKRMLDKSVKQLTSTRGMRADPEAQQIWIDEILPVADRNREMLQQNDLWGRAADLQREVNAGYHQEIEAGKRIERALYERLDSDFGVIGAGAMNRRARVESIQQFMARDPSHARNFDQDLSDFIEGRERRLRAFTDHGIAPPPELRVGLKSAKEARTLFNSSRVATVAKIRAPEIRKNMSKLEKGLEIGEKAVEFIPGVGGIGKGIVRSSAEYIRKKQRGRASQSGPFARVLGEMGQIWRADAAVLDPDIAASQTDFVRRVTNMQVPGRKPGAPGGSPPPSGGAPDPSPSAPAQPTTDPQSGLSGIPEAKQAFRELSPEEVAAIDSFASDHRAIARLEQGQSLDGLGYSLDEAERVKALWPQLRQAWDKIAVRNPTADAPLVRGQTMSKEAVEQLKNSPDYTVRYSQFSTRNQATASSFAKRGSAKGGEPVVFVYDELPRAIPAVGGIKKYQSSQNLDALGQEMIVPRGTTGRLRYAGKDANGSHIFRFAATGTVAAGAFAMQTPAAQAAMLDPENEAQTEALNRISAEGELQLEGFARSLVTGDADDGEALELPEFSEDDYRRMLVALDEPIPEFLDRVSGNWGTLPMKQPEVFSGILQQVAKVRAYLGANLPRPTGATVGRPEGFTPDLSEFWAKAAGALASKAVLSQVATGNAHGVSLRTVRELWGGMFLRFQSTALAEYAEAMGGGEELPAHVARIMARDLDMGAMLGALHDAATTTMPPAPEPQTGDLPGGTRIAQNIAPSATEALTGES